MTHNFVRYNDVNKKYKNRVGAGRRLWHCEKCDTIMIFHSGLSQLEVNQIMEVSAIKCIPPIYRVN